MITLTAAGCSIATPLISATATPAPTESDLVLDISRVAVGNETQEDYLVRLRWSDGFVFVTELPAGKVEHLTSTIGTSQFRGVIEILRGDCSVVAALPWMTVRDHILVRVLAPGQIKIEAVDRVPSTWGGSGPEQGCRSNI